MTAQRTQQYTKQLKITQVASTFGRKPGHASTVRGLGLRRIRDSVLIADTASHRGMIAKVAYLVSVEEI